MLHPIRSYFEFLRKSTNQHGIHSPFVFDLVTKCFYDEQPYGAYEVLDAYRKLLVQNTNTIEVTDFGAGSKVFKSNSRSIAGIAKNAGITAKRAALLFRLTHYFKPQRILEIGTSLGLGTSALALGNPSAKITTLEGCAETLNAAKRQFKEFKLNNIEAVNGEFASTLRAFDFELSPFDLIYFDGNHQKNATLKYFDLLLPSATNDCVWIFDDIHWSEGMADAWETIKKNPKVTVTIDTFQWGLVFFRKEQEKQDFVIRV